MRACPADQIASVVPTLVFSLTLFYALFNPLQPFSRDYIEVGFLFIIGEVPYVLLLLLVGDRLAGTRWQSIAVGLAAGGFTGCLYYVTGAEIAAILVVIQMVARFQRESVADRRLASSMGARPAGVTVWHLPIALLFLSAVPTLLAVKALALGASDSVIAVLKANGVSFALGGPDLLWWPAWYFLFMTAWEVYTLPCARLARFLEAAALKSARGSPR